MSVSLVITGLTLPEHAYSDCVYCHPEDMTGIAAMLGVDAAAVVKRGTLVTLGSGELVGYLKCVAALLLLWGQGLHLWPCLPAA